MISKTFKAWEFQCKNPSCENKGKIIKISQWSDDPLPLCTSCNEELEDYIEESKVSFFIPKFSNASPDKKRAILKERSNKHFKREIAEKKRWMDRN